MTEKLSINKQNFSQEDSSEITIALDGMGGDNAPHSVLKGAELALQQNKKLKFIIFGDKEVLLPVVNTMSNLKRKARIVHTDEYISNDEKPSIALRKGRNSSMGLAINAVRNRDAQAVVSGGNTGALMAISKIMLHTLPGIDRPAIGGILPTLNGYCVMMDLGANILCDAENLFEFAVMGTAFSRAVFGIESPSVGFLNVGAEKTKGHETIKEASALIEESGARMNFIGNVEGDDIGKGTVDVVVTDGFTGNVALKTAEGTAKFVAQVMKESLHGSILGKIGGFIAKPAFNKAKKRMDPRNYNGAMFLGLNGIVVKSHGSADEISFSNAIKVAYKLAKNNINDQITVEMIENGGIPSEEDFEINIDL
jgi:glycerol-3-phosphate acyltransferase PlsX